MKEQEIPITKNLKSVCFNPDKVAATTAVVETSRTGHISFNSVLTKQRTARPGSFVITPSPGCYENITGSFNSAKQLFIVKTLMLLQLHEIENNDRLIIFMAQTLLLYPSRMKIIINNFFNYEGRW
jgi:hypothetical protein